MHHKKNNKQLLAASVMLLLVALSTQAFGQGGTTALLTGTVQDASQAVLPGATVTATNNATGIQTKTTTNSAGIYNLPGLQPGTYKVTVEMTGFQTNTKTEVRLDVGAQNRLNFEMKVAGVATQIEVSSSVQDMILESSSSTGTVLQEKTITSLPNLNNDMMDLINVMGGVVRNDGDSVFGNTTQTFAGVGTSNINVQRDGITVNDVRYNTGNGIVSPGRLDPEMVSEFKLVLTPVDAEMGRGAGQVQVLTKSGTNAYHGSALWSLMNTGIDANEWNNNRTNTIPNWRNDNEYTLSASGPIIKNKTFFFVTWDQAIVRQKQTVRSPVLTNCARKGIYRYFSGWIPGNTQFTVTTAAGSNSRPATDSLGNPLVPATNQNGTAYTGTGPVAAYPGLQFASVLGKLSTTATNEILADPVNCSQLPDLAANDTNNNGIISGQNWDPFRKQFDTTGYIQRFTALMPKANDFYSGGSGSWGDGLNVGDLKWTRTTPGQDTVYGVGEDNQRQSITAKIDHNLSSKNRLSGTFAYEKDTATDGENTWPTPASYGGNDLRKPITFTVNFTSTLRPTLLNEARVGLAYNASHTEDASTGDDSKQMLALLQQLLPTSSWSNWKGLPVVVGPGNGFFAFTPDAWSVFGEYGQLGLAGNSLFQFPTASNPFGSRGNFPSTWGDHDYRWTFNDTVTWTKGAHSFRGGAEVRITHANMDQNGWGQFSYSSNWFPFVQGGDTGILASFPQGLGSLQGMTGFNFPGFTSGTYNAMYQMMDYFAGSIGTVRQYYFANTPSTTSWANPALPSGDTRYLNGRQNEISMFFKDDWKASSSLTLNLGLRWDYYGVPWMANGLTVGLAGGAPAIFGGSAGGFSSWLQTPAFNANNLTTQQFIGPSSPNPGQAAYNKDYTSFGPAVGFAWQLPWFGKGKTTLRGGYQVSFVPATPSSDPNGGYESVIGNVPGTIYPISYSGNATVNSGYMDLSMLQSLVPVGTIPNSSGGNTLATMITPLSVRPTTDRSQSLSVYDPNLRNPYIQSVTLALTRNFGSNLTVDARYIGTFSRKIVNTLNLDAANWINNGLLNAFAQARAGQGAKPCSRREHSQQNWDWGKYAGHYDHTAFGKAHDGPQPILVGV